MGASTVKPQEGRAARRSSFKDSSCQLHAASNCLSRNPLEILESTLEEYLKIRIESEFNIYLRYTISPKAFSESSNGTYRLVKCPVTVEMFTSTRDGMRKSIFKRTISRQSQTANFQLHSGFTPRMDSAAWSTCTCRWIIPSRCTMSSSPAESL